MLKRRILPFKSQAENITNQKKCLARIKSLKFNLRPFQVANEFHYIDDYMLNHYLGWVKLSFHQRRKLLFLALGGSLLNDNFELKTFFQDHWDAYDKAFLANKIKVAKLVKREDNRYDRLLTDRIKTSKDLWPFFEFNNFIPYELMHYGRKD